MECGLGGSRINGLRVLYLDWNASAPLRAEAREAVAAALELTGNPSSVHSEGRAVRRTIELAREQVAALAGAEPRNVILTSGGTEANALALSPSSRPGREAPIRTVADLGHRTSIGAAGGRFRARCRRGDSGRADGVIDLAALERMLASGRRALVSLMAANNETGVVQPVGEAAEIVHRHGGLLHVDAVQAAGRMPLDINGLGADLLTLTGAQVWRSKRCGRADQARRDAAFRRSVDQGRRAGARRPRRNRERRRDRRIGGSRGGRDHGPRSGDAAHGGAARAARSGPARDHTRSSHFWRRCRTPAQHHAGRYARRQGRNPGDRLRSRWRRGVVRRSLFVGKVAPSHVLAAMGVAPELARGAIRVSLGPTTTEAEIDRFLKFGKSSRNPYLRVETRPCRLNTPGLIRPGTNTITDRQTPRSLKPLWRS